MSDDLHVSRGGSGDRLLVFLHGIGANAEVWRPMLETIDRHWQDRWIAPDLRGHGRSTKAGPFDLRRHAEDISRLIVAEAAEDIILVGHSFGAVVAAMIACGDFGVRPKEVVGFSVKIDWSGDDLARMRALAERPRQVFATQGEAAERALAFAGLKGMANSASPVALAGVEPCDCGFRLALQPDVFAAVTSDIADVLRACLAPLRLGSGTKDAMAPVTPMRTLDPQAIALPDAGHNAHWEQPEAVWRFVLGN